MSIKVYENEAWRDTNTNKIYENGAWRDVQFMRTYENGAWVDKLAMEKILDLSSNTWDIIKPKSSTVSGVANIKPTNSPIGLN
jgi:hypothetical protein